MALAFASLAAGLASSTNAAATYTLGVAGTPVANDLLICIVVCSGNATPGTMTGTWTWTLLTSYVKNGGADIVAIFWAFASAATSTNPVYTPSVPSTTTGCLMHCIRVTGGEGQRQPYIRQIVTNNTGALTINPTLTFPVAPLTGNGVLAFAMNLTNSVAQWTAPAVAGATLTELTELAYNTPANSLEVATAIGSVTGLTLTWTNASTTAWAITAIEFYVAGTGPIPYGGNGESGFFGLNRPY